MEIKINLGRRSGGESSKIGGALAGVEITKTKAGLWHCHIHALVFASERLDYRVYDQAARRAAERKGYGRVSDADLESCVSEWVTLGDRRVPVSKLSGEWFRATGDSVNLDCRPLRGGAYEVQRAAVEVLKYSTKLNTRAAGDVRELIELVAGTYGRRLFMALRSFRGIASAETEYNEAGAAEYRIVWNYERGEYAGTVPDVRRDLHAATLGLVGVVVGQWRRDRRNLVNGGGPALAAGLDAMKRVYRQAIRAIWRAASREALIESSRAILRPAEPLPRWVQTYLFST